MLAGHELQFVQSLKYLGAQFVAAKKLKCSVDNAMMKFYRTFNAIYSMSKGAQSERVTLQLFNTDCLTFAFSALTLLVGRQEWHPACTRVCVVCVTTRSPIYQQQLLLN